MTKKITLYVLLLLTTFSLKAQTVDEVSTGAGYANQAFYDISTGTVTQSTIDAWDIAFSGKERALGIFINESSVRGTQPIRAFLTDLTNWDTSITDTSVFADSLALLNDDKSWSEGAFNTVKDTTSALDYGWGAYNTSTHEVEGNRIFVIKKRDGSFIKFHVVSLSRGTYTFKFANLDGSNEQEVQLSKDDENGLLFYSFDNGSVALPNDYDLTFERYYTPISYGDGVLEYQVTGILLAPGVEAVVANDVDVETVSFEDYTNSLTSQVNIIGYDWKSYSGSGYSIAENRAFFVKTQEGNIYKLVFLDFEGSSTGTTTVERTLISTVSTDELRTLDISVFPNPTTDYINIKGLEDDARVSLMDETGRILMSNTSNSRIDVSSVATGMYYLIIENNGDTFSHSIIRR